jgi:hypothetical protein
MWDSATLSLELSIRPIRLAINIGGIPYLAKNERDMGHPSFAGEQEQVEDSVLKNGIHDSTGIALSY